MAKVAELVPSDEIVESLDDLSTPVVIEYKTIEGFDNKKVRIGSVTAGDFIEWAEANEGEAKRTAGLRLIAKSLVNSTGVRYADSPKSLEFLRKKKHADTENVLREILKLNKMNTKEPEKAVKND